MTRVLVAALALVVLAACGGSGEDGGDGSAPRPFETVRSGDPLPEAELDRLGEGGSLDTRELVGQPTVINFWATWCPPCVEEMPALEAVHQRVGDEVAFLGVDVEDPNEQAALDLAEETGVSYPLVKDPDRSYFTAMKGRGMPLTVLVAADGTISYRHNGPLTEQQLLDLIEEHLDP